MMMFVVSPTSRSLFDLVCFISLIAIAHTQLEGDLRLTGSLSEKLSGRLELFLNNQWGTICINGFTKENANTACRQLGSINAVGFWKSDSVGYDQGTGPIHMMQLNCSKNDALISNCKASTINYHCNHNSDVVLVCGTAYGENKRANLNRRSSYTKRNNFDGPDECDDNGCRSGSSDPPPVNVVVIAVFTPIGVGIVLFALILCCWMYGGCDLAARFCEDCCECCCDGCASCIEAFDVRRYFKSQEESNVRNSTDSTSTPPCMVISSPQRNDIVQMQPRTIHSTTDNSTSSNDNVINNDNNPPDYRHALQYLTTENNQTETSSPHQPQPPSYDSVN